ncbi:type II toxin-antitoxin system HicA family toxin [Thiocapsa sp.]|uniref:type II toxin-antitoxin system HicA family toxin n=1 Tax=Thiocapsa sp. TaxID=2024551 RepID=UPI002634622F|nr:type II toxin-antitoxin system HicA family toxin [Thiocapsa sp.]
MHRQTKGAAINRPDLPSRVAWPRNPSGVAFRELAKLCEHYFGQPRQSGSHLIFKTPWLGDPRVNIQDKSGKSKPYQVKQILAAIEKIENG